MSVRDPPEGGFAPETAETGDILPPRVAFTRN